MPGSPLRDVQQHIEIYGRRQWWCSWRLLLASRTRALIPISCPSGTKNIVALVDGRHGTITRCVQRYVYRFLLPFTVDTAAAHPLTKWAHSVGPGIEERPAAIALTIQFDVWIQFFYTFGNLAASSIVVSPNPTSISSARQPSLPGIRCWYIVPSSGDESAFILIGSFPAIDLTGSAASCPRNHRNPWAFLP